MTAQFGLGFAPFDRTYARLTDRMRQVESEQSPPLSDWLGRLIDSFAFERLQWTSRPELSGYLERTSELRTKLMKLIAGAYLHIGFDLPRALADDWPSTGRWASGPTEAEAHSLYFHLEPIFPETMSEAARDPQVVGIWSYLLRGRTRQQLYPAEAWMVLLRTKAWTHGQQLRRIGNRPFVEAQMARAMTDALNDATLLAPYSVFGLLPPTSAFYVAALPAVLTQIPDYVGTALGAAALTQLLSSSRARYLEGLRLAAAFSQRFGYFVDDYVSNAIKNPEGYEQYRNRRRLELGISRGVIFRAT